MNTPPHGTVLELAIDVANPRADRRERYDWTKYAILNKGTRVRVELRDDERPRLRYVGGLNTMRRVYDHDVVYLGEGGLGAAILAAATPVTPTVHEALRMRRVEHIAVLERLIEHGRLTLDEVIAEQDAYEAETP